MSTMRCSRQMCQVYAEADERNIHVLSFVYSRICSGMQKRWNYISKCAPSKTQKLFSCVSSESDWTKRLKRIGMYTSSLNKTNERVEPHYMYCVCVCVYHASCVSVWSFLLQLRSSFQQLSLTHFSWCSWAPFGSVQAASGTSFMYNNQRGGGVCVCVCVCVRTDPQGRCPPGLKTQYSMSDRSVSVMRAASVRKGWLDTTAPPPGSRRSSTASSFVSSSSCKCHHTSARWPERQNDDKKQQQWEGEAYALVYFVFF